MPDVRFHKTTGGQATVFKKRVFFTGSGALLEGQGLCYDRDYGTAASTVGFRDVAVMIPDATCNRDFAGVAVGSYTAIAGGQYIDIYEPGSVCLVSAGVNTVVNATFLTCSAGAGDGGMFTRAGYPGRGSAVALQTQTNQVASDWTGAASVSGTTLTATGLLGSVAAGDYVYIVGGDGGVVTAGRYTATPIDANTLTLSSAPGNGNVTFYIVSGNKLVLARLLDGEESDLQEVISPSAAGGTTTAMIGGVSFIAAGFTVSGSDADLTLADGDRLRMKKRFFCLGALGTNDLAVTVTNGIQKDHATPLAKAEFNAADEVLDLTWYDAKWVCEWTAGAVIS